MRQSETIAALATDLAQAQAKLQNAPFNAVNPHFKNKYADLAQLRDATAPILAEYGLSIVQLTCFEGNAFTLWTMLLHKSGEWLAATYPLPLGKSQEMGSAITYARRYSLAAMCGIAGEPDDDGEAANVTSVKFGPTDIPKEEGDPSAAKSKKAWGVLFDAMKRQKSTAELNRWWAASEKEIRQMNAQFRWDFFKETIYQGLRLAQKKLEIDLFWSFHEDRFARLKEQDIVRYEELEEAMLNKVDKLEQLVEG